MAEGGICIMCERRWTAGDDVLCALCRSEAEAASDTVTDPVERTLSAHQHLCDLSGSDSTLCMCGRGIEGGPGYYRRHVAKEIYRALGLSGPSPWVLGPESPTRDRPDVADYIAPTAADPGSGSD